MAISVNLVSGRSVQDEMSIALEFVRAAAMIAAWWVCVVVAVVNIGSPATAKLLIYSAVASTVFCASASVMVLFIIAELFGIFATCLILTLPTLALAVQNARLAKRRAALG